ncbi:hypothetical protein N7326_01905 [Corynebacterium sp. ES2794-CONJ1]|nr:MULTISPECIES: hypothetical protein [unclassified Corynebacterium]MCS4489047.1 hypothetical protein [Corynebacterium sp. ES2775-CONJ]MCS4531257.1 hypothetical protein [Corynebacterium sp. ES2730-CONJ]MCU9518626.1 hypothetical protein [Corynebacterium sp. ES2794-CONJ1]
MKKIPDPRQHRPIVMHPTTLDELYNDISSIWSMIKHPRSLARATGAWRPPRKIVGDYPAAPTAIVAVRRYRIGAKAREDIRLYSPGASPAYLISLRLSSPESKFLPHRSAEWWITHIVGARHLECVHELSAEYAPTYCWVVNAQMEPIASPAALFAESQVA